jgi:hypothetical protein
MRGSSRVSWAWGLLAVLAVAALLRIPSLGFGLPALNDPDELMFELGALRMLRGPTLNPGWFGHPATTTMYALALVDAGVFVTGWAAGWFGWVQDFAERVYADPTWIILPGRAMILLCGLLVIALTYRLGSRLFGRPAGLAAAALLAISPQHVTYSQIIRSDMMACVFMLAAMLAALRVLREGRFRDHAWAAVWLGAAVATKWPFVASSLAVAGAGLVRMRRFPAEARREARRLVAFGILALVALIVVSPFLLLAYPTVLANLHGEAASYHLGATGGSPLWNLGWYFTHPLLEGLGPTGLALVGGGVILALRMAEPRAIVLPVIAGFLALLLSQALVWDRWALPLLPLFAILAAGAATRLVAALPPRLAAPGALALGLCVAVPLLITDVAQSRERMNDTRQMASRWVFDHVRPGETVLLEHFAFDLVGTPYHFLFPLGNAGCVDAAALLHGQVDYATVERLRQGRSNIDYGTVARDRIGTCRADYAILSQYDRYRAERPRFPAEYANYTDLIRRGRIVATFAPVRGESGGRIIRIVRFPTAR